MKVYILIEDMGYDGQDNIDVYFNKEKAEDEAERLNETRKSPQFVTYRVETHTVIK